MKIKYIDTYSTGLFHQQVNACILKMLHSLYPNEIIYYSSKSSRRYVIKLCGDISSVISRTVYVIPPYNKYMAVIRAVPSAIENVLFLLLSNKNDLLFYNYNNALSLKYINAINKILHRKIIIVCHGELEYLYPSKMRGPFAKIISKSLTDFFCRNTKIDKNIHFCVLSESILKNVKSILPQIASCHFSYFNHPYIYKGAIKRNPPRSFINLGIVGSFNDVKGAKEFVWLVNELKNCSRIKFSITGTIMSRLDELKKLEVSLPSNYGAKQVPSEEFSRRIQELDYILFLYPSNSYKLTASGAIMDSIDWGKPIIALKNDYFCDMFKKYGAFGYLADNMVEIKDIILSLLNSNDYNQVKYDFKTIREESSPEFISKQLFTIIENFMSK